MTDNKTNKFIEKAINIHGNLYDYSKVKYVDKKTKITIICKIHGDFNQTPDNHINRKSGCRLCANVKNAESKRFTKEKFINTSRDFHGDLYDYSKVEYVNCDLYVTIICNKHGEFQQIPYSHMRGVGCGKCTGKEKSPDDFIKECKNIHGDSYDYSKTKYINTQNKVYIICKIHGEFEQTPSNHLNGHGCDKCARSYSAKAISSNTNDFILKANKIHKKLYDYSSVNYNKTKEYVDIICKIHGSFLQTPGNHLKGAGCPKCVSNYCSKQQILWLDFMASYYNIEIQHHMNKGEHKIKNSNYKADGYCESNNTIWEYDGALWHGGCDNCFLDKSFVNPVNKKTMKELQEQTLNKKNHCINEGYKYICECKWLKAIKAVKTLQRKFRDSKKLLKIIKKRNIKIVKKNPNVKVDKKVIIVNNHKDDNDFDISKLKSRLF